MDTQDPIEHLHQDIMQALPIGVIQNIKAIKFVSDLIAAEALVENVIEELRNVDLNLTEKEEDEYTLRILRCYYAHKVKVLRSNSKPEPQNKRDLGRDMDDIRKDFKEILKDITLEEADELYSYCKRRYGIKVQRAIEKLDNENQRMLDEMATLAGTQEDLKRELQTLNQLQYGYDLDNHYHESEVD